jgi:hypothetical protein
MLAMLVLSMVVSMVSITLSASIAAIDATQEQGEIYYRAQVAMERISEDLASAILPADVEFIGTNDNNDSEELLSFASMAHIVFDPENGRPGMGIIGYSLRPDETEGQLLLLRSDVLYQPVEEREQGNADVEAFLLCDRLRSVRFAFLDRNGEELEAWDSTVDEGDETARRLLPVAVSCRLEFWLNQEDESSISFETTVLLPVAMIQPQSDKER